MALLPPNSRPLHQSWGLRRRMATAGDTTLPLATPRGERPVAAVRVLVLVVLAQTGVRESRLASGTVLFLSLLPIAAFACGAAAASAQAASARPHASARRSACRPLLDVQSVVKSVVSITESPGWLVQGRQGFAGVDKSLALPFKVQQHALPLCNRAARVHAVLRRVVLSCQLIQLKCTLGMHNESVTASNRPTACRPTN